ncbi:MAG: hypothetical protein NTW86_02710 [Candidatus Sumerlaeota bacterium]|nr:hypothetical protein [Candidatus Sumerlaeota bacterium]
MRKIRLSPKTTALVVLIVILVLLGGTMLATGRGFLGTLQAIWDKFSDLLTGHIS